MKRLDLSIKQIDETQFDKIKHENIKIFEKYDGTKLNVYKHNDRIIVSYKNEILFEKEFISIEENNIKKSYDRSQYKKVFEIINRHIEFLKNIDNDTELFFEFIQKKPTLTRMYKKYHDIIFLKATKSKIEKTTDRIFSEPQNEIQFKHNPFKTPKLLFEGQLNEFANFNKFKEHFLNIESEFGNKVEGIIIKNDNLLFKLTQENQYNKEFRNQIKSLFFLNEYEKEKEYWQQIYKESENIIKNKIVNEKNYESILSETVKEIYNIENSVLSDKFYNKIEQQLEQNKDNIMNDKYKIDKDNLIQKIRDDLHSISKLLLSYKLKENQNALIIGKFRVFSKAHISMIEETLKYSNKVVLCIIRGRGKNKFASIPFDIQKNIIEERFKDKVVVITHSTGNILSIINKSPLKIKYFVCGTDRFETYKNQLSKTTIPFKIIEYKRNNDISATNIIEAYNNNNYQYIEQNLNIFEGLDEKLEYLKML
jgi:phosphopantetheine adenylyltransferase